MTYTRTAQLIAAASTVALLVVAGCANNEISTPAVLAPEPPENLVFADTTQPVRDFPQSVSYFQNGDTVGESTGFKYRSYDNVTVGVAPLVEPAVFLANIVTLPFTLISQRGDQISSGLQFPPSYTDLPPMPPEPVYATPTPKGEAPAKESDTVTPLNPPATMPLDDNNGNNVVAAPGDVLTRVQGENGPAFTIVGQVNRPGTYQAKDLKLSQAVIAAAPGTRDSTKVGVQIARPGEEAADTTLDQLVSGAVEDVQLKAGDVITVSVKP